MTAEWSCATAELPPRPVFFQLASAKPSIAVWACVIAPRLGSRRNQTRWPWSSPKRPAEFPFATGAESSAISHRKHFDSGSAKFYYTALMKRLLLKNWRAKLISVLLATTLWYLIKKNVATTPLPSETSSTPAAAEKR